MKEKTKDKMQLVTMVVVAALVVLGMAVYFMASGPDGIDLATVSTFPIVLLLVAGALYMFWEMRKSYKSGLPIKDERSKHIGYRSGYYAFMVAMYSGLVMAMFGDALLGSEFAPRHVAEVVVLCSGLAFVASYLYLSRKGD